MGDFKASIKIKADIFGQKDEVDMWINYQGQGQEAYGVDDRITEFFCKLYERADAKYKQCQSELDHDEFEARVERAEKEQLKWLKAKYE